jgi:hypothetical protein
MSKMWQHHQEDLAKSGYKPEIKYKSFIIVLHFWLHNENQVNESGDVKKKLPHFLATEDLPNHFFFNFLIFNF